MNRTVIAVGAALFAGALLGGAAAAVILNQRAVQAENENHALKSELDVVRSQANQLQQLASNLEDREDEWQRRIDTLQRQLEKDRTEPTTEPAMEVTGGTEETEAAAAFEELLGALEPAAEPEDDQDGRRWGRDGDGPSREEMETRRREAFRVARERMNTFLDESIANAGTLNEQQRLAALRENVAYMSELMQQARQVESEADREAYREDIMETRDTVRSLVHEQQNAMMRDVAKEHGITNPDDQQAFIDALRETQSSPYFRAPMLMMGGWGWDRGRGGPSRDEQ